MLFRATTIVVVSVTLFATACGGDPPPDPLPTPVIPTPYYSEADLKGVVGEHLSAPVQFDSAGCGSKWEMVEVRRIDGDLPPGVSVGPDNGAIYGVPRIPGTFDARITYRVRCGVMRYTKDTLQVRLSVHGP